MASRCGTTCSPGARSRRDGGPRSCRRLHRTLHQGSKHPMTTSGGDSPPRRGWGAAFSGQAGEIPLKSNMLIRGSEEASGETPLSTEKTKVIRTNSPAASLARALNISTWFYFLLLTHHLNFWSPFGRRTGIFMDALRADDDRVDLINNGIRPRDHLHVSLGEFIIHTRGGCWRINACLCSQMRAHILNSAVEPVDLRRWHFSRDVFPLITLCWAPTRAWAGVLAPSDHLTKC